MPPFDLRTLLVNQTGPLPSDMTHNIKLYLAKEFAIAPVFSTTLGGSFNANSGPPINALGAHPIYGPGQAFHPRQEGPGGSPGSPRSTRRSASTTLGKDSVITAAVEGFNLFNSQRPVTVDENYTAGT